jgi:hypothetical protein
VESGLPVIATSVTPRRRMAGRMAASSSLSPLLLMASTTSPGVTMPRSPWLASAGCTKNAGVPVLASVAAILRPTWPLLPMPITTTRPRHSSMARTAAAKPFALARSQAQQGARLDLEGARGQLQGARGVEGVCGARRSRGHRRRSHKIGPF